jgi:hypothetical protein
MNMYNGVTLNMAHQPEEEVPNDRGMSELQALETSHADTTLNRDALQRAQVRSHYLHRHRRGMKALSQVFDDNLLTT